MIQGFRETAGFTQLELSERLGYTSPQFISNIERGLAKIPVKKFKAFSSVLGVPVEFFVEYKIEQDAKRLRKRFGL